MPNPATATPQTPVRGGPVDEAQRLADVVARLGPALLRFRRGRLPAADLEDALAQAVLELMVRVRRGGRFHDDEHLANALRQKLDSRIVDRQRAIGGRSPIVRAVSTAIALEDIAERLPAREDAVRAVAAREQLGEIARAMSTLPAAQRDALTCELAGLSPAAARATRGWSEENYRKLRQRARQHLRALCDAA